ALSDGSAAREDAGVRAQARVRGDEGDRQHQARRQRRHRGRPRARARARARARRAAVPERGRARGAHRVRRKTTAGVHGGVMATTVETAMTVIRNPASGEEVGRGPQAGPAEAADAIARARGAFPAWWETPAAKRGAIVRAVAEAV